MSVKKIRRSEDVTNARALDVLKSLAQGAELNEIQRKTMDYLEKVVKTGDSAEAKVSELISKFGFARVTAIQLVNIMPEDLDELKTLIQLLERREFSDEELKEALAILRS